jgi:glucose/arabinose dehydrogenase
MGMANGLFFDKVRLAAVAMLFIMALSLMTPVDAHNVGENDVFVRVVSADPASRTYTFSCVMDPDNSYLRDWFIRPDYGNIHQGEPEEATILDKASGEHLTYTFEENTFYHVGCLIWNPTNNELYRGDLHIDLRGGNTWNPEIIPISGDGLSATYECVYSNAGLTPSWQVVDAQTGQVSDLGTGKTKTHTVSGHGLFDYICNVDGKGTGLPVEYFDSGDPYFPDELGVPHGVLNTRDGSSQPTTVEAQPPIPTIGVSVSQNPDGSWNINVPTTNFEFYQPPGDMAPHVNGQGHVHWYLDGIKQGRFYQNNNVVPSLPTGQHQLMVVLTANDHREYTYNGQLIQATTTVNVGDIDPPPGDGDTYSSIQNIPATCEGGTISSDIFNGGRDITCTATGKSLRIQAWDKPDQGVPQYFEMYKVSESGSGLKICLGTTCISNNGYAKSPNYPITVGGSGGGGGGTGTISLTTTPGGATVLLNGNTAGTTSAGSSGTLTIPNVPEGTNTLAVSLSGYETSTQSVSVTEGQTTNLNIVLQQSSSGGTTYTSVQNIPSACEGGSITSDTWSGGRDITCTGSGKTLRVMAWNKPDQGTPQYFEMYKISETGGSGLQICLGTTCISNNGYAKSPNYPITIGGSGGGGGTGTIALTTTPGGATVLLNGNAAGTTSAGTTGTLNIPNVPAGSNTISVSLSGYQTSTQSVSVLEGQTTNLNIVLQTGGGGGTTYSSIQNIPATCEGGTISSDIFNGGRDITCTATGKSLRIQAWDKPDQGVPQYFEMYKVSESGSGLKICLGTTCISNNGYAKSPNYPITIGGTGGGGGTGTIALTTTPGGATVLLNGNAAGTTSAGTTGTLNIPNVPAGSNTISVSLSGYQTSTQSVSVLEGQTVNLNIVLQTGDGGGTTYSSIQNIPATCEGGTISSDIFNGGRDITCTATGKSLRIQAWDKPDQGVPQYFEMYKISESGTGLKICIGTTCISDNGYAKSPNYPITVGGSGGGGGTGTSLVPVWIESSPGVDVAPNYFHLELQLPSDTSPVSSSDWEVWTQGMGEKVWQVNGATNELRFHTHTPDGTFVGSLAGQTQLAYGTAYLARVRFFLTNGSYSPWASWEFTTLTPQTGTGTQWTAASGFKVDSVATGFDYPVHVAFAPDGMYSSLPDNQEPYFYVTELYGKIKVVHKDFSQSTYAQDLLNFDPFGSITGGGQMGLIGLYVDDATGDLFAGMTYLDSQGQIKNKVVRFYSSDDGNSYTGTVNVISDLPSSASHQVQDITKGPDGKLYVGLGDALTSSNAQSDSILAGKIIRMNMDGSGVETYAKGFRNPFGQGWRPGYNVLYSTDNAPDTQDRIVKVTQGTNYGWGLNDNFATWNQHALFYTDVSPGDVEFNPGNRGLPSELTGKMYVSVAGPVYTQGPTDSKHILEITLDSNGNVAGNREFVKYTGTGYGTPLGMDFGPDGLYYADIYGEAGASGFGSEGRILRVSPGTGGNTGTTGDFRANIYISPWYPKLSGNMVDYQFTCHPIDGTGPYVFDWNFGDGHQQFGDTYNENGDGKVIHSYPYADQEYTVSCTAHDQSTSQAVSASMTINPIDYIEENP